MIYGNTVGGAGIGKTFILVDEKGKEYTAVITDEDVELTATVNDVRLGKTVALDTGVKTGEKEIPSYRTREGFRKILPGLDMELPFYSNQCQYTKLQVIISTFNTTFEDSVATTIISIDDSVYPVNSTEAISVVTVDIDTQSIKLNITNDTDLPVIIRYMTYREEH